jgi:hypothetical protein
MSTEQLFHAKVFCATFMCLQFGFVIFWRKDFGTTAAHKMLVKLTPGVSYSDGGIRSLTIKVAGTLQCTTLTPVRLALLIIIEITKINLGLTT